MQSCSNRKVRRDKYGEGYVGENATSFKAVRETGQRTVPSGHQKGEWGKSGQRLKSVLALVSL